MSYETASLLESQTGTPIPQYYESTTDTYEPMPNPTKVENKTTTVTLQNAATTVGSGTAFTVEAYKTITIEITGTSTSRTILFEGSGGTGTFYPLMGVKLSNFSTGTSTSGSGEMWTFNVTGLTKFKTRISAIAGGTVNINGTAVA